MSRFTVNDLAAPTLAASLPATDAASERAQRSLELLLELGVQTLDGDTSVLRGLPDALSSVIGHLHEVHEVLEVAAHAAPTRFYGVLTKHAQHRTESDLGALFELSQAIGKVEQPASLGRSVIVTALILLSNLSADERWLRAMYPSAPARSPMHLVRTAIPACIA